MDCGGENKFYWYQQTLWLEDKGYIKEYGEGICTDILKMLI